MGEFPPLQHMIIFPNYVSDPAHTAFIDDYLDKEVTATRMSGPFSQEEVEAILGPFQYSPCSVNSQDQGPDLPPKLRVIRNLSKSDKLHPSTNDYIDSSKFPTRFGSVAEVAKIISMAPPGTQAMTLNIAKFHRTCPILPDHKAYFVVQGSKGFFIEHACPFGCSSSESNAGSIANAVMDIWTAKGVSPSVKWVDDLNIFCMPSSCIYDSSFHYRYDMQSAKAIIDPIKVLWHKEKWSDFASSPLLRFASSKTTAVHPVVPDSRDLPRSSSLPSTPSAPSEAPPHLPISKSKPRKLKEGCEIVYNALRPHVTAEDRLFCWTSPFSRSFDNSLFNEVPQDAALILKLTQSALEKSTLENYGAGLLRFHQFCDERDIPESARMPASIFLLSAFVAWASTKNIMVKTIGAWLIGVHGWHTLHGAPWYGGDDFVSLIKSSASKKATGSPCPKRHPVTIEHLIALQSHLNFKDSFDVAVFAVALCTFWGCCCLGELTIPFRNSFDPRLHVSKLTPISFRSHPGGASSAHFHIPWGKIERQEGADLIFTACEALCLVKALRAHLTSNKNTLDDAPLFMFCIANGSWAPMVKQWFLDRCWEIWIPLNCDHVHSHSFRPGGATELLLVGVPPETVAKLGRWKSLIFLIYWRKLKELIPTMISKLYSPSHLVDLQAAFELFCIAHKLPDKIVL
ncbi:uncharacterized protein ARMOST_12680 [Armillaria ostoyae]|uniref:Tyr recombinase domain-containing protein n=1 Tax=Armillaria ostoyae TaxID=47428 RepID=A0A284RKM1_ARMOS|nr:uncharacterized protein ARMOST_12680 [Armillaria ostoyae]